MRFLFGAFFLSMGCGSPPLADSLDDAYCEVVREETAARVAISEADLCYPLAVEVALSVAADLEPGGTVEELANVGLCENAYEACLEDGWADAIPLPCPGNPLRDQCEATREDLAVCFEAEDARTLDRAALGCSIEAFTSDLGSQSPVECEHLYSPACLNL